VRRGFKIPVETLRGPVLVAGLAGFAPHIVAAGAAGAAAWGFSCPPAGLAASWAGGPALRRADKPKESEKRRIVRSGLLVAPKIVLDIAPP